MNMPVPCFQGTASNSNRTLADNYVLQHYTLLDYTCSLHMSKDHCKRPAQHRSHPPYIGFLDAISSTREAALSLGG